MTPLRYFAFTGCLFTPAYRHGVAWVSVLGRCLLGSVFVAAAIFKWRDMSQGPTLYGSLAPMGIHLPALIIVGEVFLGLWLLSGMARGAAGFTGVLTLSLFTGAVIFDMLQPHPIPCRCMGAAYVAAHSPAAVERGLALGIVRNVMLVGLAATVWLSSGGTRACT